MKKVRQSYLSNHFIMNKIDFYTCWDDFQLIQRALEINSKDTVFLITSELKIKAFTLLLL